MQTYIAGIIQPYIQAFENSSPKCVDYLSFDGAGNVQRAGNILAAKFPRIIVTHGAEHVLSLYFQDCFKLSVEITIKRIETSDRKGLVVEENIKL